MSKAIIAECLPRLTFLFYCRKLHYKKKTRSVKKENSWHQSAFSKWRTHFWCAVEKSICSEKRKELYVHFLGLLFFQFSHMDFPIKEEMFVPHAKLSLAKRFCGSKLENAASFCTNLDPIYAGIRSIRYNISHGDTKRCFSLLFRVT